MSAKQTDRKTQMQVLLAHFGTCGCNSHCQKEQYGDEDEANSNKPNGRFSQCEVECQTLGIPVPEKAEK